MFRKTLSTTLLGVFLLSALFTTGCFTVRGPSLGVVSIPIPVSPYFQKKLEDQAYEAERYDKVPVLGPLPEGVPHVALDPPSDDEVMRALEAARPIEGGLPFLHEVERSNVRIIKEPMADEVGPRRFYPLVGPAQLHHCSYKCTIYFSETTYVGWPIPYTIRNEDAQEVVYIDHDHLHMVGNVDGGPGSNY